MTVLTRRTNSLFKLGSFATSAGFSARAFRKAWSEHTVIEVTQRAYPYRPSCAPHRSSRLVQMVALDERSGARAFQGGPFEPTPRSRQAAKSHVRRLRVERRAEVAEQSWLPRSGHSSLLEANDSCKNRSGKIELRAQVLPTLQQAGRACGVQLGGQTASVDLRVKPGGGIR